MQEKNKAVYWCTCGRTQTEPYCDGSHKGTGFKPYVTFENPEDLLTSEMKHPLESLQKMAKPIRFLTVDSIEKAQSGHPGMPLGMADVATVLFAEFLKFDPQNPTWPDRDRFVLSAGHGSMLLYALLYLTGYPGMTLEELKNFRQWGSATPGHPEYGHTVGVEATTGPLAQGIGMGVGMALAERTLRSRFGKEIIDHFTYVIAGDGCLMEGLSEEAISFAGHQRLGKLIVFFDNNGITIDGPTTLSTSTRHPERFRAAGWHVQEIDGHDYDQIFKAITAARLSPLPSLIVCKTVIGQGAPTKAAHCGIHGTPLGKDEILEMRRSLTWPHEPFKIPEFLLNRWRAVGQSHVYENWKSRLDRLPFNQKILFERIELKEMPYKWQNAVKETLAKAPLVPMATRKSSEIVLEALIPLFPELIGGSADLTPSNNTYVSSMSELTPENPEGSYIRYGIREHAMGAIMNGLALHGELIPYGGTFLVFTDYMRGAMRLSALMKLRVIYIMTHDSIWIGEDGPTHQPIEHLMSLRLMPELAVFRPADLIETAECWMLALERQSPSVLALSRQNLPPVRTWGRENLSARGGYVLSDGEGGVSLLATGSEVSLALDVQALLKTHQIDARVVSMPCLTLFDEQPQPYKESVLGEGLRVAIEAGSSRGWERYVGSEGLIFGIDRFGASAPPSVLFEKFGFTAPQICEQILKKL